MMCTGGIQFNGFKVFLSCMFYCVGHCCGPCEGQKRNVNFVVVMFVKPAWCSG